MAEKEYFDPASVTDLETARLALRWALERIHHLSEENVALKDSVQKTSHQAEILSQEAQQKDEALKRWKQTIELWQSAVKDQKRMEDDLREELRREMSGKIDQRHQEELANLKAQLDASGQERKNLEARIQSLRLDMSEAARQARLKAEAEGSEILKRQEISFEESKRSFLDRLKVQEESLRAREEELLSALRATDERFKARDGELRRHYESERAELARQSQEVLKREETSLRERLFSQLSHEEGRLKSEEERLLHLKRSLEEDFSRRSRELEDNSHRKADDESRRLQERLDSERHFLEKRFRDAEDRLEATMIQRQRELAASYVDREAELLKKFSREFEEKARFELEAERETLRQDYERGLKEGGT